MTKIKTKNDIYALNIIDFSRLNGYWPHQGKAMDTIFSWLQLCTYTISDNDLRQYEERDDFPAWDHIGNHSELGSVYWNWFKAAHPESELTFSDEPDFWGRLIWGDEIHRFWGDIGKVSASTFALTIKQLRKNDLWISVLGYKHQVVLEAQADLALLFGCQWGHSYCLNSRWPYCAFNCPGFISLRHPPDNRYYQIPLWSEDDAEN